MGMRVMKLVKKVPQLQMIVMGLIGGLKSIGYIMILLLLVFYLYAIVGIYSFRDNDPWHYGDLFTSLLTLFRCSTLEDWTDVMYINYFGCASPLYDSGIYTYMVNATECLATNYTSCSYSNGFPADVAHHMHTWKNGSFTLSDTWIPLPSGVAQAHWGTPALCNASVGGSPGLTIIYFLTFIIVSALVMLSLFIGAVTMSMTESMAEMKEQAEEDDRKRAMLRAKQKAEEAAEREAHALAIANGEEAEISRQASAKPIDKEEAKLQAKLKAVLISAWDGVELLDLLSADENDAKAIHNPILKLYFRASIHCQRIVGSTLFVNFITFVICIAGIMVGIGTYDAMNVGMYGEVFKLLDEIILGIFCLEIILKTVGEYDKPYRYFVKRGNLDGWNTFDFVVVAGTFMPGGGSMVTMLRLLRLLRVLKLVKSLPELQVIVVALIGGLGSIAYIGVILFLVFYVFAIAFMILFAANDPWHFGNLHHAMLSLFRAATLEDWTDIMYINMYGCMHYGYGYDPMEKLSIKAAPTAAQIADMQQIMHYNPGYIENSMGCTEAGHGSYGWLAAILFSVFTVIGALVLMTLFIGVVTTSMEEATEKQNEAKEVAARVKELQEEENLDQETVDMYEMCFGMIDVDDGGTIDEDELRLALKSIGRDPTPDEMDEMMGAVDEDGSGEIDFAEFVEFMINLKNRGSKAPETEEIVNSDGTIQTRPVQGNSMDKWNEYLEDMKHDMLAEMEKKLNGGNPPSTAKVSPEVDATPDVEAGSGAPAATNGADPASDGLVLGSSEGKAGETEPVTATAQKYEAV